MNDHNRADALPEGPGSSVSRRTALATTGLATASAGLLAASCSTVTPAGSNWAAPNANNSVPESVVPAAVSARDGGMPLAPASSIPVGGGQVFHIQEVVVTQPTAGQFVAFSAVCPHAGCMVNAVSDRTIECPCHGSKFDIADGSVVHGPAQRPLLVRKISADGGLLRLT